MAATTNDNERQDVTKTSEAENNHRTSTSSSSTPSIAPNNQQLSMVDDSDTINCNIKKSSNKSNSATSHIIHHAAGSDHCNDHFSNLFDASMDDLEGGGHEFDSDSDFLLTDDATEAKESLGDLQRTKRKVRVKETSSSVDYHLEDCSDVESDESSKDTEIIAAINNYPQMLFPFDTINNKLLLRPYLLPFQERRRLSQCKEEDEFEDSDRKEEKQKSEKLQLDIIAASRIRNNSIGEATSPKTPDSPTSTVVKGKFTVTRTLEDPPKSEPSQRPKELRKEVLKLSSVPARQNAMTIHFPCSSGATGYSSVRHLFSPTRLLTPHLDRKFFDTSMIEIRSPTDSTQSLDRHDGTVAQDDDVWIRQPKRKTKSVKIDESSFSSADEVNEDVSRPGSSRPSSAPAEPNAKAARKESKRLEKEARRQEKELRRNEKEARKVERETARRLEREAAKLGKLNSRNVEKMTRSTELVAPRSGSLERRRSGEDSPVLNQSTVHGIASPNRRPTIFDVFRPRTKTSSGEAGKQTRRGIEKDLHKSSSSDRDGNSSTTSSTHSGSGGIMQTVKTAIQHTGLIGGHRHHSGGNQTATTSSSSSTAAASGAPKYNKDGSAHPHGGSDAQYYHTVTAVRRADASRSPMTKVMDLFRHRSNSAVSEADKRKARAAAHQQQLAAQNFKEFIGVKNVYFTECGSLDVTIKFSACIWNKK